MRTHGPSCLEGPFSGTRFWWQEANAIQATGASPGSTDQDGQDFPGCHANAGDKEKSEDFRADLVARVRKALAAGTYDTPEKWETALGRLLQQVARE